MSATAVEHPCGGEPDSLLDTANRLAEQNPGCRVEIIGGVITVAPPPDGPHGRALTKIMRPFIAAGLDDGETEVIQALGVWLPGGPADFAIPDLSIVDADLDDHLVENNCYDPAVFRLVLEVTSSNYNNDLRNKVAAYSEAKIPVYVIIDRKHGRVHVLTEPMGGGYESHQVYAPGQTVTLPESIGAPVTLDVDQLIQAGRPRA
ncbi:MULTISPECIES: Uma2 family endonuclease [unclassified Streptomyces]|jgi:Uma2 family endonuclease|uniref:Uma2 family endonuclease n=1 Tax=unclassified Streptomyces TaxID=2593676 RepID=UPI00081B3C7E|nr:MULTISPECIES: Uma2 family endonuclease [unclassified Streptomyces]MYQ83797.1 Uma2 family endonuclease [Streptomyces sp. SID4936]SCD73268.1 Endonuclease, Uma2 family (restriction endonuclease fold) [Streptomyces sp. DvalAA-43]